MLEGSMITVCHPVDEIEQMLLISVLEASNVPYFIVGRNFGSLYPGIQIPWYNERSIRVPSEYVEEAQEIIDQVRETYVSSSENLTIWSKLRMFLEVFMFGWIVDAGKKRKPSNKRLKNDSERRAS